MAICKILFDQNNHGTYFSGQIITGRVIITLNKKKRLKGIQLKICGYASATWKDRRSGQRREHHHKKRKFTGREDYMASNTFLVGSESGHDIQIEGGIHTFAFQCLIPEYCPSSFEGTHGYIRYTAKVVMINSCAKNHSYTVGFTVLKLLDLNSESTILKMPASVESMQGLCFSTAKPILLTVDIPHTGYVPGQMVLVSSEVNNQSNYDAKKVYVYLYLKATYTSDHPRINTKTERICLIKRRSKSVPRRTRRAFTEILRVPATTPTCEHISKVVRISYEICVIAIINGLIKNPKAVIPITVGNVPLQVITAPVLRRVDAPTTSACATVLCDGTEQTGNNADVMEGQPKEPSPPTYEEAMFMTAEIREDDTQSVEADPEPVRFTPRFPVFDVDGMLIPESAANAARPTERRNSTENVKYLI